MPFQKEQITDMISTYQNDPSRHSEILQDLITLVIQSSEIIYWFYIRTLFFLEVVFGSEGVDFITQIVDCGILEFISGIYTSEADESILV